MDDHPRCRAAGGNLEGEEFPLVVDDKLKRQAIESARLRLLMNLLINLPALSLEIFAASALEATPP